MRGTLLVVLATLLSFVSAALAVQGEKSVPDFLKVKLTYFDIRGLAEPIRLYLSSVGSCLRKRFRVVCSISSFSLTPTSFTLHRCTILGRNRRQLRRSLLRLLGLANVQKEWNCRRHFAVWSGSMFRQGDGVIVARAVVRFVTTHTCTQQVPLMTLGNSAPGFEDAPDLVIAQSHAILRFWAKQARAWYFAHRTLPVVNKAGPLMLCYAMMQGYATTTKLTNTFVLSFLGKLHGVQLCAAFANICHAHCGRQHTFFDMVAGGVQDMRQRYSELVRATLAFHDW